MKNKKFFLIALFLVSISKLSAETFIIEYSEWLENYPKGVDEWIIEREERYKWTDGENITEEYYSNYKEGYHKIENDHKTYYRYILNDRIPVDSQNNIITDLDYCTKEKCYLINLDKYRNIEEEPEEPEEPQEPQEPEIEKVVYNPKTSDYILYYDIVLFICLISIVLILYKEKIILVLSNRFKKIKNNCNIES